MSGKKYPTGHIFRDYPVLQGLLESIKKANSTEIDAVINSMEGLSWESAIGPYKIRKQDHAGIGKLFVGTYATQPAEPFVQLKEMRSMSEESIIETPSPGKKYVW